MTSRPLSTWSVPAVLTHYFLVHDWTVQLLDGSYAPITHIEYVVFSLSLILTNVLYVLTFHFNLISVDNL
jgi:hypothetical protein